MKTILIIDQNEPNERITIKMSPKTMKEHFPEMAHAQFFEMQLTLTEVDNVEKTGNPSDVHNTVHADLHFPQGNCVDNSQENTGGNQ